MKRVLNSLRRALPEVLLILAGLLIAAGLIAAGLLLLAGVVLDVLGERSDES